MSKNLEEATLLNPSYCSTILSSAIAGWESIVDEPYPFVYSFIVLPIILHRRTRNILPRTTKTSMANWIQENQDAKVGFFERTKSLKPFTQKAILFGVSHNLIRIGNHGALATDATVKLTSKWAKKLGGETGECIQKATFLGRWLHSGTTIETTLPLWGITL